MDDGSGPPCEASRCPDEARRPPDHPPDRRARAAPEGCTSGCTRAARERRPTRGRMGASVPEQRPGATSLIGPAPKRADPPEPLPAPCRRSPRPPGPCRRCRRARRRRPARRRCRTCCCPSARKGTSALGPPWLEVPGAKSQSGGVFEMSSSKGPRGALSKPISA